MVKHMLVLMQLEAGTARLLEVDLLLEQHGRAAEQLLDRPRKAGIAQERLVSRRIVDRRVLHLIRMWLDCPVRTSRGDGADGEPALLDGCHAVISS